VRCDHAELTPRGVNPKNLVGLTSSDLPSLIPPPIGALERWKQLTSPHFSWVVMVREPAEY
jgi:hypothetical protein